MNNQLKAAANMGYRCKLTCDGGIISQIYSDLVELLVMFESGCVVSMAERRRASRLMVIMRMRVKP